MMKLTKIAWLVGVIITLTAVSAMSQDGPKWIGAFFVKGKVGLKWQPIEGASQYDVYRKPNAGDFTKIITVDKTHYFDIQVTPGETFTYKLAAAGTQQFSTEKSVTIPGAQIGEFLPPTWSGVRLDRDKVYLNWDKVPGAIAYNVYRSATSGSGYEVVGNAASGKHADKKGMTRGETYYYVVTALNEEFDETEYSEERSIKYGRSAEEIKAQEAAASEIVLEDIPLTFLFDVTTAENNDDMNQPADVFVNSKGNIYVTDALRARVNCYDNCGKFLFSFGELTPPNQIDNPADGTFSYPFTIFIDGQDQVYVSDVKNCDLQVFTPEGKFVKRIKVKAEEGQEDFRPNGIHVFADGRIVVTDTGNHRYLIIDQTGKILFEKGTRGQTEGEQFSFPDELIVTSQNIICIVDVINCRIQEFDLDGNFIRAFGEAGQSAGTFGRPKTITEGEDGRLWVADAMGNTIQVFTPEGEVKSAIVSFDHEGANLITPRGIFIKDGRLYVVNRLPHRLMVFKIG